MHLKKRPFVCHVVSDGYFCLKPFATKGEFEKHQASHRRGTLKKKKMGPPKDETKMLHELRVARIGLEGVVPRMPATPVQYITHDGVAGPPKDYPNAPVLFFECNENQHRNSRYSEHDELRQIRAMRALVAREYGMRLMFILIRFNPDGVRRINGYEQIAFRNEEKRLTERIRFAKQVQGMSYVQSKHARLHVVFYDMDEFGRPFLFDHPSFVHEDNPIAICFNLRD